MAGGAADDGGRAVKRARTDAEGGAAAVDSGEVKLKFRNYVPSGEELADAVMGRSEPEPSIEEEVKTVYDKIAEDTQDRLGTEEDVDLLNLAPQKIDWDLKRDIAKKLEKLERKTQRAIAEIINERMSAENSNT